MGVGREMQGKEATTGLTRETRGSAVVLALRRKVAKLASFD